MQHLLYYFQIALNIIELYFLVFFYQEHFVPIFLIFFKVRYLLQKIFMVFLIYNLIQNYLIIFFEL